jgi:hypothetical protein
MINPVREAVAELYFTDELRRHFELADLKGPGHEM